MDVFTCYTTSKIAIKVVQYPTYSVNACFKHEFVQVGNQHARNNDTSSWYKFSNMIEIRVWLIIDSCLRSSILMCFFMNLSFLKNPVAYSDLNLVPIFILVKRNGT